jgi:D-sedoheptulose 7-phosphate isomerase
MNFSEQFLNSAIISISELSISEIETVVDLLSDIRYTGRVFVAGSGGGAGHASHMVCDLRKLCGIEAYAPYDNVSELTARTNDEGFEMSLSAYLAGSHFGNRDCLFILSVGGGTEGVSENLIKAMEYTKAAGGFLLGVVGRDGGELRKRADASILIKTGKHITPIVEGLQAVIWHLLVEHPKLKVNNTVW